MTPSPSAAQLLADLAAHGIHIEAHGDAIRYRPAHAMAPALRERLQASKFELLALWLIQQAHDRGDADLAERLAEAWGERVAICTEDGKVSQQTAEQIALQQLRMMMKH